MTTTEPNISTDDAATVSLPEPGDALSLGRMDAGADDLIAKLADDQIDQLIGKEDERAHDVDADAAIDDAIAAGNAIETATPPADLSASPTATTVTSVDGVDLLETSVMDASAVADAAPAPSFNPPKHAEVEMPPAAVAVAHESDAEAVSRELAADVAMLSTPLPAVVEREAAQVAQAGTRSPRSVRFVFTVPAAILAGINFPVQAMSDRGREIIGGVGIVTLVNAAGLLIYLGAFAHRH